MRDDVVVPLRYGGFGPVANLSYTYAGDRGRHDAELRAPFAFPSNRYGYKALAYEVDLAYSYVHRVVGSPERGQLHLGGQLDWSLNNQLYEDWDRSHVYWLNVYELGLAARYSRVVRSRNWLAARLDFPLLGIASRPPAHFDYPQERLPWGMFSRPHEDMGFTSVHEHIAFTLRGDYAYQFRKPLMLGVSYLLEYRTFSKPERIQILSNTVMMRVIFTPGSGKKAGS